MPHAIYGFSLNTPIFDQKTNIEEKWFSLRYPRHLTIYGLLVAHTAHQIRAQSTSSSGEEVIFRFS